MKFAVARNLFRAKALSERNKFRSTEIQMAIVAKTGIQLEPHQVVLRPLVTEKGTHVSVRDNAYGFQVHPLATKDDVRNAVQTLWGVKVVKVRTQTRVGKPRRTKTGETTTQSWKKAIVTLHEDDRIAFF